MRMRSRKSASPRPQSIAHVYIYTYTHTHTHTETNAMGNCCCCAGSAADPSDQAITAQILTNKFVRYRGFVVLVRYVFPSGSKAVYVRDDKVYFDCCTGCIGGYPLKNITSAEVVRDATVRYPDIPVRTLGYHSYANNARRENSSFCLNPGVKITGSDGTVIAFVGGEGEMEKFVQDLNTAMKTRQKESELSHFHTY